MSFRDIMTKRFCISLGAALTITSVLVTHRGGPPPNIEGAGIVFVYFPSLCAAPGDARDCREIPQPVRPSFASMAECSAYAESRLREASNPRLMASCLKQREI